LLVAPKPATNESLDKWIYQLRLPACFHKFTISNQHSQ
jgi:hypothetical protein